MVQKNTIEYKIYKLSQQQKYVPMKKIVHGVTKTILKTITTLTYPITGGFTYKTRQKLEKIIGKEYYDEKVAVTISVLKDIVGFLSLGTLVSLDDIPNAPEVLYPVIISNSFYHLIQLAARFAIKEKKRYAFNRVRGYFPGTLLGSILSPFVNNTLDMIVYFKNKKTYQLKEYINQKQITNSIYNQYLK